MEQQKIDTLLLQETKVNTNSKEDREKFVWYFSTGIDDANREKVNELKNAGKKVPNATLQKSIEHRG